MQQIQEAGHVAAIEGEADLILVKDQKRLIDLKVEGSVKHGSPRNKFVGFK